jgi:DNA modification methylase
MNIQLINANSLHIPLADQSVHCVVTSPPYYGLRDYGVDGQIGLEETPEAYIENMVQVFREVWRVMRDDGTLWLNIGDSYNTQGGKGNNVPQTKWAKNTYPENAPHRNKRMERGAGRWGGGNNAVPGLKPKDLIGIPWMLAFALRADGWYLRSDIIWSKSNAMPESVTDRPTKAHEYLFLLSKSERYFYDHEAIKDPSVYPDDDRKARASADHKTMPTNFVNGIRPKKQDEVGRRQYTGFNERWDNHDGTYTTRNKRTVWEIPTVPFPGAHFATYPPALVEPCIKAGTSERGVCPVCGAPWIRIVNREQRGTPYEYKTIGIPGERSGRGRRPGAMGNGLKSSYVGWQPTCQHDADPRPALVLDPFAGSGTTGLVARSLGRNFIGLDLSLPYLRDIARERLSLTDLVEWTQGIQAGADGYHDLPLFVEV